MNVCIRVDASTSIGSGHVMRCLTLAEILVEKGAYVFFVCRIFENDLCDLIERKGFKVYKINLRQLETEEQSLFLKEAWSMDFHETKKVIENGFMQIDLLIIDHYSIDHKWETAIKKYVDKVMVIDDLADRMHDCDFLLDQNYYVNKELRYKNLVPKHCKQFLGPQYAILRKEFRLQKPKKHDGKIKRLHICFGGTDPTNETKKAIESFLSLQNTDLEADVIVGRNHRFKREIHLLCEENYSLHFHYQADNMAELLNQADLAIGACGTSTWERCYLGLPTIVVTIANNQEEIAETLATVNIISYLGTGKQVTKQDIMNEISDLLNRPKQLIQMSCLSQKIMGVNEAFREQFISVIMNEGENN